MLRVPIYMINVSPDQPIGYVTWDGRELKAEPDNVPALHSILSRPLMAVDEIISPQDDPEKWLRALPHNYGGSYTGAGEVEEI